MEEELAELGALIRRREWCLMLWLVAYWGGKNQSVFHAISKAGFKSVLRSKTLRVSQGPWAGHIHEDGGWCLLLARSILERGSQQSKAKG